MAANKLTDWRVRAYHVGVYSLPFIVVALAYLPFSWAVGFVGVNALVHFAIDTRRWAEPKEGFESYPIVIDQTMHVTTIAVLAAVVTQLPN